MTIAGLRRAFEQLMSWIVIVLLITLTVEVIIGVIFRLIDNPLAWYDEVASVLLAWLTYYGAALAALKRAHIGFPGLVNALPPAVRLPVVLFAEACVFAFFILLAWYGWVVLGLLGNETLVTVAVPVKLTQSVMPIGAALYVIAEALCLPDLIRYARSKDAVMHDFEVAKEVLQ